MTSGAVDSALLLAVRTLPARTSMLCVAASISSGSTTAPAEEFATRSSLALVAMPMPVSVSVRVPPSSTLPFSADSEAPAICRYPGSTERSPTRSTTAIRVPAMSISEARPAAFVGDVPASVSKAPPSVSAVASAISKRPASQGARGAAVRPSVAASAKNCAPLKL